MTASANDILLQLASFRSQAFATLLDISGNDDSSGSSGFSDLFNSLISNTGSTASATDAGGMNLALNDPVSAFNMMSTINNSEVLFKAQYAELTAMGSEVDHLEEVGGGLAAIDTGSADSDIKARLQDFVDQYNAWVDRFGSETRDGGLLDNVQGAEASLFELKQNITSIFNGAADGIHGLGDLGITIDPATQRATFDSAKLDTALANNRSGAVNAIDQFSANFAKSADLLNDEGNFIQNALANRSKAIDYIDSNLDSLQAEFGTGAAAKPTGQVAKALAAYAEARAQA